MQKPNFISRKILPLLMTGLVAFTLFNPLPVEKAEATIVSRLRDKIANIEQEVANNQRTLAALEEKTTSLRARLDQLELEIQTATKKIQLNELKIQELQK